MLNDLELFKLARLVRKLKDTHPLSRAAARLKQDERSLNFWRDHSEAELRAHVERNTPSFMQRTAPANGKDSLDWQVSMFDLAFDNHMRLGEPLPPNIPWRIAVILRRETQFDLEKEFLAAYFYHFWSSRGSATDTKLGQRAVKIGIDIPAIPDSTRQPFPH